MSAQGTQVGWGPSQSKEENQRILHKALFGWMWKVNKETMWRLASQSHAEKDEAENDKTQCHCRSKVFVVSVLIAVCQNRGYQHNFCCVCFCRMATIDAEGTFVNIRYLKFCFLVQRLYNTHSDCVRCSPANGMLIKSRGVYNDSISG